MKQTSNTNSGELISRWNKIAKTIAIFIFLLSIYKLSMIRAHPGNLLHKVFIEDDVI